MNEVIDIIYNRRAVRRYKDKPVEKKIIEQLIDAGRMAPSGMNQQPWMFYVVTDKQLIQNMDDQIKVVVNDVYTSPHMVEFLNSPSPIFHGAPIVIFITVPGTNEWAALDVGMCSQNIMLAAKALGLDTCPVGLGKFLERTCLYSQLEIPSTDRIIISLTLGYGDEQPPVHERLKNNVKYIRAGVTSRVEIRP